MSNESEQAIEHATEMERRRLWATAFHNAYDAEDSTADSAIKVADQALAAMDKAFSKPSAE